MQQSGSPLPQRPANDVTTLLCDAIRAAGKPSTATVVSSCSPEHPIQPGAVYQAASLTKPVTAFVALNLVREGRLDLQAPVSRYLPDGYKHRQHPFNPQKAALVDLVPASTLAQIPVATLLNHSSGLPNWTSGQFVPAFEPGTRWHYSGEGYALLQGVIGAVTGEAYETCVSKSVFQPFGMRHSALHLTDNIQERLVNGSSRFQLVFSEANAAASLYTTAEDYAKLISALLADTALLELTIAKPISVDAALGLTWGYGWGIETTNHDAYLWHWGNNPGYRAFAMVSLSSRNGFVLFTNSADGMPLAAPLAQATIPAGHGVFRFSMLS